jgi:hypothetical protein
MRINADPPRIVIPPEVRPNVGAVGGSRSVSPIGAQPAGAPAAMPPASGPGPQAVAPAAPSAERRQFVRRGDERRKQQVPVLLDMRVEQRRRQARREEDETSSIDVKA